MHLKQRAKEGSQHYIVDKIERNIGINGPFCMRPIFICMEDVFEEQNIASGKRGDQ